MQARRSLIVPFKVQNGSSALGSYLPNSLRKFAYICTIYDGDEPYFIFHLGLGKRAIYDLEKMVDWLALRLLKRILQYK